MSVTKMDEIIEAQKKYAYLMDMYETLDDPMNNTLAPMKLSDEFWDKVDSLRDLCWAEALKEQEKAEIALKKL